MLNLKEPLHRTLVRYRCLPIAFLTFCCYIIFMTVDWVLADSRGELTMVHAAIVGAILTPIIPMANKTFSSMQDDKIIEKEKQFDSPA